MQRGPQPDRDRRPERDRAAAEQADRQDQSAHQIAEHEETEDPQWPRIGLGRVDGGGEPGRVAAELGHRQDDEARLQHREVADVTGDHQRAADQHGPAGRRQPEQTEHGRNDQDAPDHAGRHTDPNQGGVGAEQSERVGAAAVAAALADGQRVAEVGDREAPGREQHPQDTAPAASDDRHGRPPGGTPKPGEDEHAADDGEGDGDAGEHLRHGRHAVEHERRHGGQRREHPDHHRTDGRGDPAAPGEPDQDQGDQAEPGTDQGDGQRRGLPVGEQRCDEIADGENAEQDQPGAVRGGHGDLRVRAAGRSDR